MVCHLGSEHVIFPLVLHDAATPRRPLGLRLVHDHRLERRLGWQREQIERRAVMALGPAFARALACCSITFSSKRAVHVGDALRRGDGQKRTREEQQVTQHCESRNENPNKNGTIQVLDFEIGATCKC